MCVTAILGVKIDRNVERRREENYRRSNSRSRAKKRGIPTKTSVPVPPHISAGSSKSQRHKTVLGSPAPVGIEIRRPTICRHGSVESPVDEILVLDPNDVSPNSPAAVRECRECQAAEAFRAELRELRGTDARHEKVQRHGAWLAAQSQDQSARSSVPDSAIGPDLPYVGKAPSIHSMHQRASEEVLSQNNQSVPVDHAAMQLGGSQDAQDA